MHNQLSCCRGGGPATLAQLRERNFSLLYTAHVYDQLGLFGCVHMMSQIAVNKPYHLATVGIFSAIPHTFTYRR